MTFWADLKGIYAQFKAWLRTLPLATSVSWKKRKSMILNAIAGDLIVVGSYHGLAKYCNTLYGWHLIAASYTFCIINLVLGIPLLFLGIKAMRFEFKGDSWDTKNVYMLVDDYNKRLEREGLGHLKWSSKLSKGYVWKVAEREKMFCRLEKEGKYKEVIAALKDEKSLITKFIEEMTDSGSEEHELL